MATACDPCITWHSSVSLLAALRNYSSQVSYDVVKTMGRPSLASFQRYWCWLSEIALNHVGNLPATSQMHIWPLGLTWKLAFYAPSAVLPRASWGFSFTHPKVTICNSKYIIFDFCFSFNREFLLYVVLSHMFKLLTNWVNRTAYFQSLIRSLARLAQSLLLLLFAGIFLI